MKFTSTTIAAVVFLTASLLAFAQKPQKGSDRFVRLMSAQSVRLQEIDGRKYRRADGPARFLHNDTWLICDTALWSVDDKVIYAIGHVSIEQENTELTGERLTYIVEQNLAEFRGALVQLQDKEGNVLRTRNLDYNTKDSVAVFRDGAAMRDKNGQLIESIEGTYESKVRLFDFYNDVNMFSDSVFVKTSHLVYDSGKSLATFPVYTEAWKDDGMLSGNKGWYNDKAGKFFFTDNVHAVNTTREGWCDSLYYDRKSNNLDMLGNAQVADSLRNVSAMAGYIEYIGKKSRIRLVKDPVVLLELQHGGDSTGKTPSRDSVFMRADTILYWSVKRCDLDTAFVAAAKERSQAAIEDPVANIRAKAAEQAAKARQEAIDNDPNAPPELKSDYIQKRKEEKEKKEKEAKERQERAKFIADSLKMASLKAAGDSLAVDSLAVKRDSLDTAADSLIVEKDTSKVGFLYAVGKVKVFKNDLQAVCDSLNYCDLDSLARLFKEPVVWNDVRHQYNADSLYLVVRDGRMQKAMLLSNAFIHVDEDGQHFDQIRGTEMAAFFDKDMQLQRFDAMGSTTALFFLKEKDRISTMNRNEATMMSAQLKNGEISRVTYYESPKSDATPVAQTMQTDKFLKGYHWTPENRPEGPWQLTSRIPRASERTAYLSRPRALFRQAEKYFPGYLDKIYVEIAQSDSLKKIHKEYLPPPSPSLLAEMDADSTYIRMADSLSRADSSAALSVPDSLSGSIPDSLALARADSIRVADSLYNAMTPAQKRALERQKKIDAFKAAIAARELAREKRWAEKDAAEKAKKEARVAARKKKADEREQERLERLMKQKEEEDALRAKMKEKLTKKYQKLLENGKLDLKKYGE